jgi:hypothetical protein
MHRLFISLVCICALTTAGAEDLGSNAALRYWQAIAAMPKLSDADTKTLTDSKASIDDLRRIASNAGGSIRLLQRGAAISAVNWGLDGEIDGPALLLPHLAKLRELARLALAQVRIDFADQKYDAGLKLAADTIRMARHTGNNEILISILVEYSIETMTVETLAADLPSLPAEVRTKLVAALDALPARSTITSGMQAEKRLFVGWMKARVQAGDTNTLSRMLTDIGGATTDPAMKEAAQALAKGVLMPMIEAMDPVYDEAARIVQLPADQFAPAAKEFEGKIRSSPNPLVRTLMPAISSVRMTELRMQAKSRMLRAAITQLAGDTAGFNAIHDPLGDAAFEKSLVPGGFELRSKLTMSDGKPVTLRVGRAPANQ